MPFAENSMVREDLHASDMFTCDRYHCHLSKSDCLTRQGERMMPMKKYRGSKTEPEFPKCRGSLQGMQIRLEKMMLG